MLQLRKAANFGRKVISKATQLLAGGFLCTIQATTWLSEKINRRPKNKLLRIIYQALVYYPITLIVILYQIPATFITITLAGIAAVTYPSTNKTVQAIVG